VVTMTKTRASVHGRRHVGTRRTRVRLIDLNGPKLYAMIIYRLSMTALIVFALLEMGRQGS